MAKAYQVRQVLKAIERLASPGEGAEGKDNVTK